jgi:hypothetical protein
MVPSRASKSGTHTAAVRTPRRRVSLIRREFIIAHSFCFIFPNPSPVLQAFAIEDLPIRISLIGRELEICDSFWLIRRDSTPIPQAKAIRVLPIRVSLIRREFIVFGRL